MFATALGHLENEALLPRQALRRDQAQLRLRFVGCFGVPDLGLLGLRGADLVSSLRFREGRLHGSLKASVFREGQGWAVQESFAEAYTRLLGCSDGNVLFHQPSIAMLANPSAPLWPPHFPPRGMRAASHPAFAVFNRSSV